MTHTIKLEQVQRNMTVMLNIASARPIKLLSGVLHEGGQHYKVLGTHGTMVRLSRIGDRAKLMVSADMLLVHFALAQAAE